jgi:hypothetical protein
MLDREQRATILAQSRHAQIIAAARDAARSAS